MHSKIIIGKFQMGAEQADPLLNIMEEKLKHSAPAIF
jgi:hypothetical protein